MACLTSMVHAWASDVLTVENVALRQGAVATVSIGCECDTQFKGYQFDVELDEGLSLVLDENDRPVWENGFAGTDHTVSSTVVSEGKYRFVCVSTSNTALPQSGALLKLKVTGNGTNSVGDEFGGKVTAIEFTTIGTEVRELSDALFTVTITDPWIELDENSLVVPEPVDGNAMAKVKRIIKAGEWSTLVLPFAMTEAQVKETFGDDVQLAEYIEHEMNDEATQITVTFDDANLADDGLMANYPYIIKTSKDIIEFTVDDVTIEPDEEGAVAEYTNGRSGSRKVVYGTFIGTYHAQTVVPENCLFLNGSQFWYSKGLTKMKAFRAYFDLVDVLASVEGASSRINIKLGGGTKTGISQIENGRRNSEDAVYDLQGRRVSSKLNDKGKMTNDKVQKGLYIVNGKKVIK